MRFYLGTHKTHWLGLPRFADVPLFVSHRALRIRAKYPRAVGRWSLDSGGFTELSMHGKWVTEQAEYLDAVRTYRAEIGGMDWCAPQDWMCEDVMLDRTGLTVSHHQGLSTESVASIRQADPTIPVIPVLQGNTPASYLEHFHQYAAAGIDLTREPVVGVGSVCRRQATAEIGELITTLHAAGVSIHGFGVKMAGVRAYGEHLTSADSMAWSFNARYDDPLPGHTHKSCSNCPDYALRWRDRLLNGTPTPTGPTPDPIPVQLAFEFA